MERVEDAGEPKLAPSIDVNDNREEHKARVCGSDTDGARKGSVYISAYVNPGGAGQQTLSSVLAGCKAGVLNGFPEQLDMVCPDGEEGTRSDTGRVTGTSETEDKPDKVYLNSQLRSAVSFMGKTSPDMKMPNGDVTHEHMDHDQTHLRCLNYAEGFNKRASAALDRGVKVGNGGLLIVNSYDTLSQVPFGALGGLPAPERRVFVHQSDGVLSSRRSCERVSHHSAEEAQPCDPDPAYTLSDFSTKLSLSPLAENTSDYTETDPSPEEDFSDTGPPVRPQNLRTNPRHPISLSCDATPLSPGDDGYFGAEGSVDECLSSGNTFDGGRRQSAPDRVAADPDASSDQMLDTKRHGIADFLTR